MTFTTHGGGLEAAIAAFGGATADWLDLSTALNPRPWPGVAGLHIDWQRLPDAQALGNLEATAAQAFGCPAANVCAVPGSELGLRLIGSLLHMPAFYRIPGYGTHAAMVPGARPLAADDFAAAAGATLILSNPANPDGRLWPRDMLQALLREPQAPKLLIVDEAYADCHPGDSLAADIDDVSPLLVLRSFGKFFGLAGVRLGFVLGPRPFLQELRARLGAWPLSAAAIAIGTAAYADSEWQTATRARLRRLAASFDELLRAAGHEPQGASPLFRRIAVADAQALFEQLARRRILTRPFAGDRHHLRIGLPGTAAARARLAAALGRD